MFKDSVCGSHFLCLRNRCQWVLLTANCKVDHNLNGVPARSKPFWSIGHPRVLGIVRLHKLRGRLLSVRVARIARTYRTT